MAMTIFWIFYRNPYRKSSLKEDVLDSSKDKAQIANIY